MNFQCGKHLLGLDRPHIMGIVNVTPDSFSDGGRYTSVDLAVVHALQLVADGADILDIGGESTRPGVEPVSLAEELARVIPVIQALALAVPVPISIDTYKPEVMRLAIEAGASMVNDVQALRMPGALDVVANSAAGVCLMHMQGTPQTMQLAPHYDDVLSDVRGFLSERLLALQAHGIAIERIVLDPGFGFGKSRAHNITLLKNLQQLGDLGAPLLVGLSRKSILAAIAGDDDSQRLPASLAAAVISAMKGAKILRVHDVKATAEALKIYSAIH
ncbi:MAG: dihydropteroate synthase [Methylotenera sp.]|nr:dihydropteroate synthase [Methylotenera sp.]